MTLIEAMEETEIEEVEDSMIEEVEVASTEEMTMTTEVIEEDLHVVVALVVPEGTMMKDKNS